MMMVNILEQRLENSKLSGCDSFRLLNVNGMVGLMIYRVLHFTLPAKHEILHAQNDEINGNVGFLQPYPVAAVLEIVISDVCLSMNPCRRQPFPVSRNFFTSRCAGIIFGNSLSGYALISASRTAANDFDAK
jgi:hypothetical protein